MIKTKNTPLWVFLAFSAIETRKGAVILISSCILFTFYSMPWSIITGASEGTMISQLFVIDDWSWAGMMVPITIWYVASLAWMEKHNGWEKRPAGLDS